MMGDSGKLTKQNFFWSWTNHRWPWKPKSQKGIQKTLSRVWSRRNSSSHFIKKESRPVPSSWCIWREFFYPYLQALRINPHPPYTHRKTTLQSRGTLAHTLEICLGTAEYLSGRNQSMEKIGNESCFPSALNSLRSFPQLVRLWARMPRETNGPIQWLMRVRRIPSLNFLWYYVLLPHHPPNHSPLSQSECLQRADQNDLIPVLAVAHN